MKDGNDGIPGDSGRGSRSEMKYAGERKVCSKQWSVWIKSFATTTSSKFHAMRNLRTKVQELYLQTEITVAKLMCSILDCLHYNLSGR